MDFDTRKAATLASLGSSETDKSPKGTLDAPIIHLIDAVNSHPSYFTTSSCSGRISILSQPSPQTLTLKPKKKASGGSWLYITHEPADPDSVVDLLFPAEPTRSGDDGEPVSDLVFRFEPFILAVECRDVSSAQSLVSVAIASGFRESGITSAGKRVIVAVRCSIRLELPLGSDREILVSREYVRYVVTIANEKMAANRKRTDGFFQALRSNGFGSQSVAVECGNGLVCGADGTEEAEPEKKEDGDRYGLVEVPSSTLSFVKMEIVGEPIEKLFLWGHSACKLGDHNSSGVLVFGGFGGMGRHGRRNDCFLLDPFTGALEAIYVLGGPSPRLGHTASLVGDCMFVIGGRAGPEDILSDIWVFNTAKKEWKFLKCFGNVFPPRHRHAAAVVGQKIYVFGGLNSDTVSSSFHALDTVNMEWKELSVNGEKPSARHSHSMVAYGSQLYVFGGYDGEKALGDLYSFNIETCQWKKEEIAGRGPQARFSHSMFVYRHHIGVIGGCPVQQHFQELSILDLRHHIWRHVKLDSSGEALFLRSTANVFGDDLVMIGGGAACYAFGTKFSEPMKTNLVPLISLYDNLRPVEIGGRHNSETYEGEQRELDGGFQNPRTEYLQTLIVDLGIDLGSDVFDVSDSDQRNASYWVLQLERKHAKTGKDILKKFGWLDLARKVYSREDGIHICFPINQHFCNVFRSLELGSTFGGQNGHLIKPDKVEGLEINDSTCLKALNVLKECGATKLADEVIEVKKAAKSPFQTMSEAVACLIKDRGLPATLLEELPTRWERLGDILVLPVSSFKNPLWNSIEKELWPTVAKSLGTRRLARQGRVASTDTRDSTLEILVGDSGWVDHRENGIIYSFDATKCMFSWGNLSEKQRMAHLGCRDEVIVDLFAGIGYFVLPFLVGAKAKLVYACEWNPHAVEALKRNLQLNSAADRCIVLEGDNRATAPKGVADRVCLGLIPTSEGSWVTAVRALRTEGGMLHIHGNVKDSEEGSWIEHVSNSISEIAISEGLSWQVCVEHLERVKWYAPHIRHLVADVRCRPPIQNS